MLASLQKRNNILFALLLISIIIFFVTDLIFGSISIPLKSILSILSGEEAKKTWTYIVLNYRLPKAISAVLVGAGLSVTGLMMQTLFRNPLAGPYVLGISSGASLGVALFIMASSIFPSILGILAVYMGNWSIVISAIMGSSIIFIIIGIASVRLNDSVSLLIIGIMFGSITGAIVSILQFFSSAEQLQNFIIWTFGSLSSIAWLEMKFMFPIVLLGLIMSFVLIKPLDALLLGENYARSVGVSVNKSRILIIISTALIAGTLTAFAGPIAFIGVAVPHIARSLFSTASHKTLMPASVIIGALLMLICDIISQLPGSQTSLPINSVTALFGGPVVIWVILKGRSKKSSF